ncbi:ORF60 [Ranid herpesvirus 1]|uniref:ORF60 n=1 Tax=Ranid herpesvirus 1 TaxID=85655 RepID=Q14VP8_9VIRU|nr:ORF60 [Ranid herpesvirus 1]ABG25720.1 ORF60 [Ranid herpesvirus 1]
MSRPTTNPEVGPRYGNTTNTHGIIEAPNCPPPFLDELRQAFTYQEPIRFPPHDNKVLFTIRILNGRVYYLHNDTASGRVTLTRLAISGNTAELKLDCGRALLACSKENFYIGAPRFYSPPSHTSPTAKVTWRLINVYSYLYPAFVLWWEPAHAFVGIFADIGPAQHPTPSYGHLRPNPREALGRRTEYGMPGDNSEVEPTTWQMMTCGVECMPPSLQAALDEARSFTPLPRRKNTCVYPKEPDDHESCLLHLSTCYMDQRESEPAEQGPWAVVVKDAYVLRGPPTYMPLCSDPDKHAAAMAHSWLSLCSQPEHVRAYVLRSYMRAARTFLAFLHGAVLGGAFCKPTNCLHTIRRPNGHIVNAIHLHNRLVIMGIFCGTSAAQLPNHHVLCIESLREPAARDALHPMARAVLASVQLKPIDHTTSYIYYLLSKLQDCYTATIAVRRPAFMHHPMVHNAWSVVELLDGRMPKRRFSRIPITSILRQDVIFLLRELIHFLNLRSKPSLECLALLFAAPADCLQAYKGTRMAWGSAVKAWLRTYAFGFQTHKRTPKPKELTHFFDMCINTASRDPLDAYYCKLCYTSECDTTGMVAHVYPCGHSSCESCFSRLALATPCHKICPFCRQADPGDGCTSQCSFGGSNWLLDLTPAATVTLLEVLKCAPTFVGV